MQLIKIVGVKTVCRRHDRIEDGAQAISDRVKIGLLVKKEKRLHETIWNKIGTHVNTS